MSRRWLGPAVVVLAVVLVAVTGYWWQQRHGADPAGRALPSGAPTAASCWTVDETAAMSAFPWPSAPVDCALPHTAEVFHLGQVDPKLVEALSKATGEEVKLTENLMYAQARRACTVLASTFLGGGWHTARVRVLADWVKPQRSGYFGCAVVETGDPAGARYVRRTGTLRNALAAGESSPLAVACVARGADGSLGYAGCDQPHEGEFVGTYTVTPAEAPFDESAVRQAANAGCARTALAYLGLPAEGNRSDLRPAYVGPLTASDWLGSDQTFACYAMAAQGRLRGSVKGLGGAPLPG